MVHTLQRVHTTAALFHGYGTLLDHFYCHGYRQLNLRAPSSTGHFTFTQYLAVWDGSRNIVLFYRVINIHRQNSCGFLWNSYFHLIFISCFQLLGEVINICFLTFELKQHLTLLCEMGLGDFNLHVCDIYL